MVQRSGLAAATGLVAIGALLLSGCSSSKKTANSPTSTSSAVTANAAAALVPAAVKGKGTLTIGVDASYPPDESIDTDGHTIIGMDADLAKALAATLGLKANLVNVKFDSIIPRLQSGTYDLGMSSFTDNKTREKTVDFVTYFQAGEGFYVKAGNTKTFNGLDSLCGAKVSVENGTTEQTDAQTQAKTCTGAGKPTVTVLSFSDQNGANLAVSSGRADVGFADSQVVGYIVKQSNGQFTQTGTAFAVAPYGIALPKGNGMAAAVLAAVKKLMADGTYTKILSQWGVQDGAITNPVINGATS
ncbi:MAG: ABC transporter substrate-binding protein [Actinomycetota bacterium]|nr:ABC transporter substrate-binding protein [Actinomycetota bacterium]